MLAAAFMGALFLASCGNTGAPSEKQVLEQTYQTLVAKADQLQGSRAAANLIMIRYAFDQAILESTADSYHSPNIGGRSVSVRLPGSMWPDETATTTVGALQTLVKGKGGGVWSVTIDSWEFLFDERTGELTGRSEDAKDLLEDITLSTYHSTSYGYYVDYPLGWLVKDDEEGPVMVYTPVLDAFFFIDAVDEAQLARYGGLAGYIQARIADLRTDNYSFELTDVTPARLLYTYVLREGLWPYEARHYFVQHGNRTYEIVASARKFEFQSLSMLYDPRVSFRFQP